MPKGNAKKTKSAPRASQRNHRPASRASSSVITPGTESDFSSASLGRSASSTPLSSTRIKNHFGTQLRNPRLVAVGFISMLVALCFGIYFVASQTENLSERKPKSTCSGVELQSGCFDLERATTNEQRIKGLSDRQSLPAQSGMLFVFENIEEQCFWMKDMKFSIDMIWLDKNKTITKIEKNVSPDSYPQSFCQPETKYVLELNSGEAEANGLKVGSTLQF